MSDNDYIFERTQLEEPHIPYRFRETRNINVTDILSQEVKNCYENIQRAIIVGNMNPDEGTLEDIEWILKYFDFGRYIELAKPRFVHCDVCGKLRLCIGDVVRGSFKCYRCQITDGIMTNLERSTHLDTPIIKKYLTEGVVDPTVDWTSYADMVKKIHEETMERLMRYSETPFASDTTRERMARSIFKQLDDDTQNRIYSSIFNI